ncbi:tRNA pseudouridine(55) synthase TruB [Spiractinospora alimapuensis]|nr:tRNA pseudouridine(55) synthase TruB [Spiractinospora alimapuensis]
MTSHDVVARVRRIARTRKVGHAGTLDPMATGVLVLGLGKATRLLGHLTLTEKEYTTTVRLGQNTSTEDAEGEPLDGAPAVGVPDDAIHAAVASLTGEIQQVPPRVSAIKVGGKRSYAAARAGEDLELSARTVTVADFVVDGVHRHPDTGFVDVDARVRCSSGTYVRSLARDLGAALEVGGHLTALRRTRVGPYTLDGARRLEELEEVFHHTPLAQAVADAFPVRTVEPDQVRKVAHGNRIPASVGVSPPAEGDGHGMIGLFSPDGEVLALAEQRPGGTQPVVVFA